MTRPPSPVNPCAVLGIDSGAASGYSLIVNGSLKAHGVANTVAQRYQVVCDALAIAETHELPLVAVLEDHTGVPLSAGTRAGGGKVTRGPKQILGMGSNRGRWLELLELHGVRCTGVGPKVWRPAVLGIAGRTKTDRAKAKAVEWCRYLFNFTATHDEAEACAIAWWGSLAPEVGELAAKRKRKRLVA